MVSARSGEIRSFVHWCENNGAVTLKIAWQIPKVWNSHHIIPLLGLYPRERKILCPHKNFYVNVYSSSIHNSQKVGTTQMSTNWWMNKRILYKEVLLGNKKGWSTAPYCNMEKHWKYATWKKLDPKGHILYDSINMECQNRQTHRNNR